MKAILTLMLSALILSTYAQTGGAAINTTGGNADPSAILDVSSANQGILIPRMTETERNNIVSPAEGLQIYNTTTSCLNLYSGSAWKAFCGDCSLSKPVVSNNGPVCEGQTINLTASNVAGATYSWTGPDGFTSNQQNPSIADASVSKGGVYILNISLGGCTSEAMTSVTVKSFPVIPIEGTHTPSGQQIVWNWNSYDASGYKVNTTNNYNTATDVLTSKSYTQTNLNFNTPYTLYVWGYNNCGHSNAGIYTQTTNPIVCGTATISFTYRNAPVTYGTVSGAYNSGQYCWLDRNLGASQVPNASTDNQGYGDYFQFGRPDDGHQLSGSSTTAGPTTNYLPGANFITVGSGNWYNGSTPAPDNLWQGVNGISNPCPGGFRIPTSSELNNERGVFSQQNAAGAYASPMKFPVNGWRLYSNGSMLLVNVRGFVWSSTVSGTSVNILAYGDSSSPFANVTTFERAGGVGVRCIKD